jgi:hypothetical protein
LNIKASQYELRGSASAAILTLVLDCPVMLDALSLFFVLKTVLVLGLIDKSFFPRLIFVSVADKLTASINSWLLAVF